MASRSGNLNETMQTWIREHACRPSDALSHLCEKTLLLENGEMLTSPEQLQFLGFLAKSIDAKHAIEVGVFTGASAIAIGMALPTDGVLIACDLTDEYLPLATQAWDDAGLRSVIQPRIGPALETLQALVDDGKQHSFDFMYIDADKINSKNYYELGVQLVRPGGIIAIDNMFYGGQVADPTSTEPNAIAMRALADFLLADTRIDYALIPIGDGLSLSRPI
ncbi:MAG: putative O-methyltransferase YrrM [Phycisphaerales bacterium]|jgi:predicted O-methyltransferase YrrM